MRSAGAHVGLVSLLLTGVSTLHVDTAAVLIYNVLLMLPLTKPLRFQVDAAVGRL